MQKIQVAWIRKLHRLQIQKPMSMTSFSIRTTCKILYPVCFVQKLRWLDVTVNFACTRTFVTSNTRLKKKKTGNVFDNAEEESAIFENDEYRRHFNDSYLLPNSGHRVLVIQPDFKHISGRPRSLTTTQHQLDEACALVDSLPRWTVCDTMIQNIKSLNTKELFGKGSFKTLTGNIRSNEKYTAVFISIQMLTGEQLATLQKVWRLPVYDRFTIVLQIFKTRARTKEAKLQVALAEIPYYRSRLKGLHMGTLDQQKGGMSYIGGSGETFLEIRKRILHDREQKIKKALEKLKSRRDLLRKERVKKEFPVVAVVGYTNAGKTSLIKALTHDESMQPRDQLFATLDVTVHAGLLSNRMKVLYVDTVGFISDIPTSLIASFSATLEDALNADVILHIRDISHPDTVSQKHNVLQTLDQLHLPHNLRNSIIEVCNKIDLMTESTLDVPVEDTSIAISATSRYGLNHLTEKLQQALIESTGRVEKCMKIPMNGPHLSWLYKEGTVEDTRPCEEDSECLLVDVVLTEAAYAKFVHQFNRNRNKT